MSEARLAPVPGRPLLLVRPGGRSRATLILADLHLGLGAHDRLGGGPPEAAPDRLASELVDAARRTGARRLVIAGDVKHPIVGVPPPLRPLIFRFFGTLLEEGLEIAVVRGNHDVGLDRHLPREVDIAPATGMVRDGIGIFHGHCWPSKEVLGARRQVAGHLHPGFRLAPSADVGLGKERCWVRAVLPPPPVGRRRRARRTRAREVIVLPAFNPIAGTEPLNRRRPRPSRSFLFSRFLALGEARAYLLDGTDLGPIPTLEAVRPRAAPPRGPPAP